MITATSTSLLNGLRDPNNDRVWSEFNSRYQPLLLSFCRRLGLSETDAQDASQEALLAFSEAYRKGMYDAEKGRLRTWLSRIARNKVIDMQRQKARSMDQADPEQKTHVLNALPDEDTMEKVWEAEWHRALVSRSIEAVQLLFEPVTLRAFEMYVLEDRPAEEVAAHLGISANAVFKAKRRVVSRMRELYRHLNADW